MRKTKYLKMEMRLFLEKKILHCVSKTAFSEAINFLAEVTSNILTNFIPHETIISEVNDRLR